MTNDEGCFIDTNILVYACVKDDERHFACGELLKSSQGSLLYLSPQILAEFYSTITSPKRVTTPFSLPKATEFIEILMGYRHMVLLPISTEVPQRWLSLLKRAEVRGPQVFDFLIAATMLAFGIEKLATYNGRDFKSIPEIKIYEPESPAYIH